MFQWCSSVYSVASVVIARPVLLPQGPFVAAFGQANLGDVSPNTKGPRCIDTGLPCDMIENTCGDGKVSSRRDTSRPILAFDYISPL